MKRGFVIDTSVYSTYAAYNKLHRLVDAINQYNLHVFINDQILTELEKSIVDCLMIKDVDPSILLRAIKEATIYTISHPRFMDSPDPKDNFLFDLALQTGSEVIVTQEKG